MSSQERRASRVPVLDWDLLILMSEFRKGDLFPDDPTIHASALKYAIKKLGLRKGTKKYEVALEGARKINPSFFV